MADVLSPTQRSYCMSQIRSKDTKPEILVRRGLFALGFRFRLHKRNLPGSPDLVFPKYCAVVFVHGCLWHGHACPLFRWPATNASFWYAKIVRNRETDKANVARLREAGWRVFTVWECALRGPGRRDPERLLQMTATWLRSRRNLGEVTCKIRSIR